MEPPVAGNSKQAAVGHSKDRTGAPHIHGGADSRASGARSAVVHGAIAVPACDDHRGLQGPVSLLRLRPRRP